MMKNAKLLETPEFFKDFLQEAKHAEKSIWVQTMFFEPGYEMEKFEDLFITAARRGIDVRFTIDWVTEKYYESNLRLFPSFNLKWKYWLEVDKRRKKILEKLQQAGVKIKITNTPSFLESFISMAGRNHNKMFLVDRKIAWIGGVNLAAELEGKDIMVKFADPKIVSVITRQFLTIYENKVYRDYSRTCNHNYTFYADGGRRRTSIIFDEALTMIRNAKKNIVLISQFVPDGKILRALRKKSKQGNEIIVITGDKHFNIFKKFPNNFFYLILLKTFRKEPTMQILHYPGKVHVKLLIVDDSIALFGSHNFVWSGIFLGTEEIAMKTTDKNLVQQFLRFTKKLLKKAELPDEM